MLQFSEAARVCAAGFSFAVGIGAARYVDPTPRHSLPPVNHAFIERVASEIANSVPLALATVREKTPVLDGSSYGLPVMPALLARGPASVAMLAAFGPTQAGWRADVAAGLTGKLGSLSWATVPAIPRPDPAPEAKVAPPVQMAALRTDATAPVPVLPSLVDYMGAKGLSAPLIEDSPLFGWHGPRSEPSHLPMSRARGLAHAYSPVGDPLAELETEEKPARPRLEFIMPFVGGRITSLFNQGRHHPAIDLAGRLGSPVFITTVSQRVTFAGWRGGYGNAVITVDDFGRTTFTDISSGSRPEWAKV